jgi:hypothetical protein
VLCWTEYYITCTYIHTQPDGHFQNACARFGQFKVIKTKIRLNYNQENLVLNSYKTSPVCVVMNKLVNFVKSLKIQYKTYSSVGIATRYGLGGTGIESRWGRDFSHPTRPALVTTQPPIQWVPSLSWR